MNASEYAVLDAVELRWLMRTGIVRAQQVARAALEHIELLEPGIHAWRELDAKGALVRARALDDRGAVGVGDAGGTGGAGSASGAGNASAAAGLLAGVPIGVKDIIATADLPTRYGSPIFEDFQPQADADCVTRMRAAGAVIMGKTVTTEFAYFSPGPTANPRNTAHTPGGSSSGSAAAVASGMVPLAFGTQTAGSLIRPASFCGVFALKPTYGAFSLEGAKPFAPSLDTLGWLARSADDLELMRCAMAGVAWQPLDVPDSTELRLGICHTHEWAHADAAGAAVFERGAALAAAAGIPLTTMELPNTVAGLFEAQKTVMAFEAAVQLATEQRLYPAQLSAALKTLLETGQGISEETYRAAWAQAEAGREIVRELMRDVDALLTPAAPGEAPEGLSATGDPVFARVWTLLGLPCVNVPGLTGPQGLPIGMQLVGHSGRERDLLRAAACLQRAIQG